jgi:putative intracellular protease/amidase
VTLLIAAPARRHPRWRRGAAAALVLLSPLLAWALVLPGSTARADIINWSAVQPVTTSAASLAPGQSAWVTVVWTTRATVTDWSTTVSAPAGITVSYPTTRGGSDTSLYGSSTLVGGTRDFTAFKLAVPYTQRTSFAVTVTSTYTGCTGLLTCLDQWWHDGNRSWWWANGIRPTTITTTVTVPVVAATGAPFSQDTTTVTTAAGSSSFQAIAFTGGQTDLAGFTVQAGALPAGLAVAYQGDGTVATLNGGSTLLGRSSDHVSLRFDATGLAPGRYVVPLTIRYTAAAPVTAAGTVTLVVS